jgi:GTPase
MGIIETKYETSSDIVFNVSKFDFRYDSDTFPQDVEDDMNEILLANGDIYYIQRQATSEDSMGNVTDVTHTSYRIYGMFQDITIKDRQIHEMGLAVPGNRKFYMLPEYSVTSGGVTTMHEVKEGDIITDTKLYAGTGTTGQFRVVKIIKQWYLPSNETYRIAIVQSINLDGIA